MDYMCQVGECWILWPKYPYPFGFDPRALFVELSRPEYYFMAAKQV